VISSIRRSWSILLQTVSGASRSLFLFLFILLTHPAQAIIDTNTNGVSDLWEKTYNSGKLYTNFDPQVDTDADGWTNGTEAISGTDPLDKIAPKGILPLQILQTPAVYITGPTGDPEIFTPAAVSITWQTLAGKQYTLFASVDLTAGSWLAIDNDAPRIGTTALMGNAFPITQPDGSSPPAMFYRLAINDADSDGDTLTNHEEAQLNTDPFSIDTDLDGFPDNTDPAPLSSATLTDPDGAGLVNAQNSPLSIASGIIGRWNLEDHQIISNPPSGYTPFQYPDSAGTNPATSFSVFPHPEGMVSKATNHAGGYVSIPTAVLGTSKIYTTAFWALLEPGSIADANGAPVALFSHHQRIPWIVNNIPNWGRYTEKLNGLWFEKFGNQERLRAGTHEYTNHLNGVPTVGTTTSLGINILRNSGTADDGKWHHYAFVHNDGIKTLYIDGALVGTATHIPATISINSIYSGISLGRISGPSPAATGYFQGTSPTRGRIDRLRIWNRPVTETEATALYREDIDKDGLWDITENNRLWRDNNSDGLETTAERTFSSSPFTWQPTTSDTDDDGLTDIQEQSLGTKIDNPDSDGDLLPDGWEDTYQLNPLIPNDPDGDTDQDGLTTLDEYRYNTNPNNANTDGDTKNDGAEVNDGSHPNDASDGGNSIPTDQQLNILLGIGDESRSHSEDYVLHCYHIDSQTGQEKRIYTLRSGGYGGYKEETPNIFRKGESYTFQIDWQSSNLTPSSPTPGNPVEGPDYDYTFKVQPQGSNTSILIDAYDPKTKTIGNAILAVKASNVATTESEFKEKYENKRVAVLNPKLEWVAVGGYQNIDDHVDPWSNPIGGKRIFPDFKDPSATQIRHAVQLVVKGALPGLPVYVKAFDVDDSTSETFDIDNDENSSTYQQHIIDGNEMAGNDNHPDYLNTSNNGHFWTGLGWGTNTSNKVADANGQAKFILRVGMQPGNNYRAVGSVNSETMYSGVQTDSPTTARYLGPETNQTGETSASPLLTVWRRLWVENDSMEGIPTDTFGYLRNDLNHDLTSPTVLTDLSNGINTSFGIPAITDQSSFSNLENGRLVMQSVEHPVIGTSFYGNTHFVQIAGDWSSVLLGSGFRLYDDDNYGLSAAPLPRNDLVNALMKSFFKPSFIEIMDSGSFNPRNTVPFRINDDLQLSTVVNASKDLSEQDALWVCPLTTAYQFTYLEDSDPNDEDPTFGGTRQFSNYDHSTVFIETCRESYEQDFRVVAQGANPQIGVTARTNLKDYISAIAAHEMGHHPGNITGDAEHEEGGLMEGRPTKLAVNPLSPKSAMFSAKSILRFRQTHHWSKK
jgi:Concanavalin A-like lectin/glucanases superfamily